MSTQAFVAVLIVCAASPPLSAQTLDAVRQQVEDGDAPASSHKTNNDDDDNADRHGKQRRSADHSQRHDRHHDNDSRDRSDDDDNPLTDLEATMVLAVVGSPFWLPHVLLDDDFNRRQGFAAYPYAEGHNGLLLSTPPETEAESGADVAGYVLLEGAYRNDELWRGKLEARLHTTARVGLVASAMTYAERRTGNHVDTLTLIDANAIIAFAQSQRVIFFTGLGARALAQPSPWFGINVVYGFDLFVVDPLVLSARFDLGSLGRAKLAGASFRAGVILGRFDVGVGYDVMAIGAASVGGATLGLRTWF